MSKVNLKKLCTAFVAAGKKPSEPSSQTVASHGEVSLTDAGVRLVSGQFGQFLSLTTPSGVFNVSIAKGSPKGASKFSIEEREALKDIANKESGELIYEEGAHFFVAIAVVEEEEE